MPLLEVRSLSKRYGATLALDDVSLDFEPGEVHAVVGENGAGKSTLVGVIAGHVTPDQGSILFPADPVGGPPARVFRGRSRSLVAMVHQHFMLVPSLTVAENLALDRLGGDAKGGLRVRELATDALEAGERLGWKVDPQALVRDLPVGIRQRVEVLKALSRETPVVVFDEPTAVLGPDEVADLLAVLGRLRGSGRAVILIAHKLSEVFEVADRISVLRRGRLVGTWSTKDASPESIAEAMVGGAVPRAERLWEPGSTPHLMVDGLMVRGDQGNVAVDRVSFEVAAGEIFGIGGVDGNGQVELAEALASVRDFEGSVRRVGREVAYIPQDRQNDGLALGMSILDNLAVGALNDPQEALVTGPFLKVKGIREWAQGLVERFSVKTPGISLRVDALSGGNQQKVVVARALARRPDLLVAVNPTRGLDLRAAEFVHSQVRSVATQGTAVVLISTDLDELQALSHRLVYLSRGRFVDKIVGSES